MGVQASDSLGHAPVQSQHLSEDKNEYHGHEDLGLVHVCPYTLYTMVSVATATGPF